MAKAKELNLEIVSDTTFADGNDTDFSVQMTDAQSKGADLIFLPIYYSPASLILAQVNAMGYSPKYFGIDGMDGILTMEGFDTSILVLVFVVLGGQGNMLGSIIAAALTILPEALREYADYRMLVYAIILILVMLATNSPKLKSWMDRLKSSHKKVKEVA